MFPETLLLAVIARPADADQAAATHVLSVLGDIAGFFSHLYTQLTLFARAMSVFFFAWSALLYGASRTSGNERTRQHALASLYAALLGLALALLAGAIAGIIQNAAGGQSPLPTPTPVPGVPMFVGNHLW